MARRKLIVDRQNDYSNEEINSMQNRLNSVKVCVVRNILGSGEIVLCAYADISYSYEDVCGMVGEAYIDGVSG